MTTRQIMFAVAVVAVVFGGVPQISRLWHSGIDRASPHQLMAHLCDSEWKLFNQRAAACRKLASESVPWDQPTEEAATLRLCPDQIDEPTDGSWIKQAEGWERAADMAHWAMQRQDRLANFWLGLTPFVLFIGLPGAWLSLGDLGRPTMGDGLTSGNSLMKRRTMMACIFGIVLTLPASCIWTCQGWGLPSLDGLKVGMTKPVARNVDHWARNILSLSRG